MKRGSDGGLGECVVSRCRNGKFLSLKWFPDVGLILPRNSALLVQDFLANSVCRRSKQHSDELNFGEPGGGAVNRGTGRGCVREGSSLLADGKKTMVRANSKSR